MRATLEMVSAPLSRDFHFLEGSVHLPFLLPPKGKAQGPDNFKQFVVKLDVYTLTNLSSSLCQH